MSTLVTVGAVEGQAPETQIARDLVRRAAWLGPVLVLACGAIWGVDGALSSAFGVAIVVVNFVVSAALLAGTARISLGLMMGAALFGYLIRLGLIFLAVLLVRDASWMSLPALGVTLIITHLGLLFWEIKYVSATLAFPGLKPQRTRTEMP
jgi:hypothetical protein